MVVDQPLSNRFAEPNDRIVLYVGRLVPVKGVDVLIEAVPKILSVHPNVKLVIIGEGYARQHLSNLVRSLGIDHKVYFAGYISDHEVRKILHHAEVQVIPSRYEPFGIVCLEAMASGVPVVASDIGGLSEIMEDGVTGLKVPPDNSDALASAVNRVLSDATLRDSISEKAREQVVKQFSWEAVVDMMIQIYNSIRKQ